MRKVKPYFSTIIIVIATLAAIFYMSYRKDSIAKENMIKIGVCIYKEDTAYMTSVRKVIKEKATGTNVELIINDSRANQDLQNEQIDTMIQNGVDALAINIVDIGAAAAVIEKAEAVDIPIVFFNREPNMNIIKTYAKARFVGTYPEEAGIIQGELILNIWKNGNWDKNGDGKIQYVMLMGEPENPEAIARTKYSVDTVIGRGVEVEKLGEAVANWDADEAEVIMDTWIAEQGDEIEFVISNNDSMAIGAIMALQKVGYNKGDGGKHIPVVGVDATEEAIDLINKGYMSATVKQDAVGMGNAVFALAKNAAEGKDFLSGTIYEYDDTGNAIRIPYQRFTGE